MPIKVKRLYKQLLVLTMLATVLISCSPKTQKEKVDHWPNAVFYEIFVRSFADSNGDGIGDLNGISSKLDYLQDLGVEAIWLTPIYPSPSYHKYDVVDYYGIDPEYGMLEDFQKLLQAAHVRGMHVIIDLVVNHTSSQNEWFTEALGSNSNPYRNWYIWADEHANRNELGEWGQQVWYGTGENTYFANFDAGMPDLNFDEPAVRAEILGIGKFWLELGVDGFRLDAIKHIYPEREKEKNYHWWEEFGTAMREVKPDVLIVGEIWAPATVIGPYLNGIDSGFNFDLSDKLIASLRAGEDAGIVSSLSRTRDYYAKINPDYVDSIMLTNHDMDRIMSELQVDPDLAKMAAALLLTLPGNPFIYYGEELGMQGKKPDEHIREPFIWGESDAPARTNWVVARYNRDGRTPPLDQQIKDDSSIYQHYKKLIHLRITNDILTLGEIKSSNIREQGIISFRRVAEQGELLVLHNISNTKKILDLQRTEGLYTNIYYQSDTLSNVLVDGEQVIIMLPLYSTLILQP